MGLKEEIKEKAKEVGFQLCGVSDLKKVESDNIQITMEADKWVRLLLFIPKSAAAVRCVRLAVPCEI
jgi:hypothetical protein